MNEKLEPVAVSYIINETTAVIPWEWRNEINTGNGEEILLELSALIEMLDGLERTIGEEDMTGATREMVLEAAFHRIRQKLPESIGDGDT